MTEVPKPSVSADNFQPFPPPLVSQESQTEITSVSQVPITVATQTAYKDFIPTYPIKVFYSKVSNREDTNANEFICEITSLRNFKFYIGVNATNHVDYNFFRRCCGFFIDARQVMNRDTEKDKILMVKIVFNEIWIMAYGRKALRQIDIARRFIRNHLAKSGTSVDYCDSVKDYLGWSFECRLDIEQKE